MTNEEFQAWLLGYFMLSSRAFLTRERLTILKNHLNLAKEVSNELTPENVWLEAYLKKVAVDHLSASRIKEITTEIKSHFVSPAH